MMIWNSATPMFAASMIFLCAATTHAQPEGADIDPAKIVQVRLIADQTAAVAGQTLTVGVEYTIAPGWHIYWSNPGDTGMPTTVNLSVDGKPAPDVAALYPAPHSFVSPGDLVSFGYSGQAMILAEFPIPADAEGDFVVEASTRYLMCADRCIPGNAKAKLVLPVGLRPSPGPDAPLIENARNKLPGRTLPGGVTVALNDDGTQLVATWPASAGPVVAVPEEKGAPAFMLFPDRVPGIRWRPVEVKTLDGTKPAAVAEAGITAAAAFSVSEPAKATDLPLRAVLTWARPDANGRPGPLEAAAVTVPRKK